MKKPSFTFQQKLLGFIASLITWSLDKTLRWEKHGLHDSDGEHWSKGEPTIMIFWHNQQLMMPWAYRCARSSRNQRALYALVSKHGDGRLAAALLEALSINTIGGSSSNGGRRAFLNMCRILKKGSHMSITPDGPTGPPEVAKEGAVKLASLTGARIRLFAIAASDKWTFKTWDALFLPKPFSRAVLVADADFQVEKNLTKDDLAAKTVELTNRLRDLNTLAAAKLSA